MQQDSGDVAQALEALGLDSTVRQVLARIEAEDADTLADQRSATEIAAPLDGEAARAHWFAGRLAQLGTGAPGHDAAGNVRARLPGGDAALPPLVLASHLDTVFAPDADLRVREEDGLLRAPGISDNSRGLAALLRLAAVLAPVPRRRPLLLVGTVGEEGAGDLRGVKHLFGPARLACAAFIAVDGAGMQRIVHRAVGSRRLRVRLHGPGGHSWSNRDRPNPVHALGRIIAGLEEERRRAGPGAGVSVGRIGGGTSINALPAEAWLEVDLRSEGEPALGALEERARALVAEAVPGLAGIAVEVERFGDRPGGALAPSHLLVRAAEAATRAVAATPELVSSSTDANVPLALGVPAIALGAGGEAGGTHTPDEWYRNARGAAGIQRLALLLLVLDRLL